MRCLEPTNPRTHQTLSHIAAAAYPTPMHAARAAGRPGAERRALTPRARMDALAGRAQQGDARAADQLARMLYVSLRPVVARMTRGLPPPDLEDVLQDVVVAAFETDLARFDPARGAFLSFVAKRLAWRIADVLRKQRRAGPSLDDVELDVADPTQTPEAHAAAAARERALLALPRVLDATLAKMKDAQARKAFRAHDLEGRTIVDVARDLRVHASNACRARKRALDHLARALPASMREAA